MSRTPFRLVNTEPALEQALGAVSRHPVIGVDTETTSLSPFEGSVRLLQIATPEQSFVIDLFELPALNHPGLRELLSAAHPIKVFHNAKFDLKMLLRHFNLEVRGVFDTLLASQLIGAGRLEGGHGLAAVSDRHLGELVDKSMQLSDWSGRLTESQYEYAAKDAELMLPLYEKLSASISELSLEDVATLEFECILPMAAMELAGMALDADCWRAVVVNLERAHDVLSDQLRRELAAGVPQLSLFGDPPNINLDSPTQVTDALANMGIKVEGTRSWQLQPLATEHPAIEKLLEYRSVQKLLSSYGLALLDHINPETGRLHADFRQMGATGGRMSCSDPNLQQVPNTPEYRSCFRAPVGRKLVIADYSQIELRILADWSQDTALVKALLSGEDLHCVTASQMLGISLGEVSKDQRAAAKQLNYGIMYGLGAQGLASRIGCSLDEAEGLLRKYFEAYSGVAAFLRDAADRAVGDRESRTRSGRLIYFTFDANDRSQVGAAQRLGKNAPIQGSSADIIKRALALLYDALKPIDAKIVNCVHDEIVVEAAEAQADEAATILDHQMVAAAREFISSVPVTVDIVVADAWLK
ncbi:MAG TPA: DNA polymerase [Blastocatellia bacterium]|nr:DNA polymerase [Blastocatellia bacterium]